MMDSELGKLFVGGISWDTEETHLSDYFRKYGEVVESTVVRDRTTGNARGFGFVLFSDPSAADNALQDKHVLQGRTIEVKRALPRGDQQQSNGSNNHNSNGIVNTNNNNNTQFRTKKIFVGGLPSNTTDGDLRRYFEEFGNITDVVVMYDIVTRRPRGFGFISFDSEEAVDNVMLKNFYKLNDKIVEVKRAVPKEEYSNGHKKDTCTTMGGPPFGSDPSWVYRNCSPRGGLAYPGYVPFYPNMECYPYRGNMYGGYFVGGFGGYGGYGYRPWNRFAGNAIRYAGNYPGYMNGGLDAVMPASGYHRSNESAENGEQKNSEQIHGDDDEQSDPISVSISS